MLRLPSLKAIHKGSTKARITLVADKTKCSSVSQTKLDRFAVSTGESPTVSDLKKAVYTAVSRANQLKRETGTDAVTIDVTVKNIAPSVGPAFLFDHPKPKQLYSESPTASLAFEKAATYAALSSYRYDRFKTTTEKPASLLLSSRTKVDDRALLVANTIAQCVADARSLGNLRHDEGTPASISDWVRANVVGKNNVKLRSILVGDELKKGGLNMLHAVGKGAVVAPRMLVLEYIGSPKTKESTALVGKGVTFDCGGLNVKPFGSMETMHLDKMGAVAVVSALRAIAELKLPVNIVASIGLVENAIGPTSYHPSTILRSLNGKTVEVTNTDAEGRLVLADLLTFVQKHAKVSKKVTSIIDLATLTGAVVAALGERRAGVFGNDALLMKQLVAAGARVDEPLWPMPIGEEHHEYMKGSLSDLTNCRVKREAGACTAAAFLETFIEKKVKWAHIDIAGPAMAETEKSANVVGAPGFGVQLLVDHFRNI